MIIKRNPSTVSSTSFSNDLKEENLQKRVVDTGPNQGLNILINSAQKKLALGGNISTADTSR